MSIVEMKVPAVGESISEVTVANWLKKEGDYVKIDEVLCELESDKATFELTAEKSGTLKILAPNGTTLPIGAPICNIDTAGSPAAGAAPAEEPKKTETAVSSVSGASATATNGSSYAAGTPSPAASKILAEKGIEPHAVTGTGIGGRITKEDALKASSSNVPSAAPTGSAAPTSTVPTLSGNRVQRREKMSSLRKTVSRRLVAVKNETAMLTTFNEVNMKPIMDLRAKLKDDFEKKHGVKLGFMSFFVKACCQALLDFPAVNAYIDGDEIVYNDYVDMSIAVSAPKGLVVPVLRNAESMSFKEVEAGIAELAKKARENKLTIDEMTGGTFTITNGGVFGSMLSTPIINAPQSAILGMHNIVERPVAENGQVVIRPIMYVALSYDHRIIDGRESVGFLVKVKHYLEDPARLLLGV